MCIRTLKSSFHAFRCERNKCAFKLHYHDVLEMNGSIVMSLVEIEAVKLC